jgi:hypothetical protein
MMLRHNNAKATVLVVGLLVLGAYLFYTSFEFGAGGQSTPEHRMALWNGVFALGLLFVMNKLRWRPLIQFAVAGALSIALPVAYAFIWEHTPLGWIRVASVFSNVLTFLAAWALWQYLIRRWRWLVAVVAAMLCLVVLLLPAVRSNVALIVLAVMILPENRGAWGRAGLTHAG